MMMRTVDEWVRTCVRWRGRAERTGSVIGGRKGGGKAGLTSPVSPIMVRVKLGCW